MRLVHFADLHLGFRQFDRDTKGGSGGVVGLNQREADVESTFHSLIDRTIELAPDLVVVGGDVFHSSRPSNGAILNAFTEFGRLRDALPNAAIVVACGNHDIPLTRESATIVNLLAPLRIHVADREAQRFAFPDLALSVLAVPDAPGMKRPPLEPDPSATYNVLVMHGEVHGMPGHVSPAKMIPREDVKASTWNYVALGHYHVCHEIAPNVWYSGSIDLTSYNPWGELIEEKARGLPGKGFIERDLSTGQHTFHPLLPRSREYLDLTLSAEGMTGAELTVALRELLDDAWPDDAVCRVVVTECPREVSQGVDPKLLREFRKRALSFRVDYREPEIVRVGGIRTLNRAATLEELLSASLARRFAFNPPADVSLEAVTKEGLKYLNEASGEDPTLIPALEASVEPAA